MKLTDLVQIDNRFEKSINLLLDLNDSQKVKLYIPTRSSLNIMKEYLQDVQVFAGGRASILIGPYGKGKSHLLLVLMAILSGLETPEVENLLSKIISIDPQFNDLLDAIYTRKKYLPVIINTNNGDLSQSFTRSLSQALKRDSLLEVVPDNYFAEAIKTIQQWKNVYPVTYKAFEGLLAERSVDDFVAELEAYNNDALIEFREIHPQLTSGSEFNPVIDDEVISVYRSVNRTLCEKYGYAGIFIIFDEFSKYIEGHSEEGFSADMKVLQDICELCNSSKDEGLLLTCVAHKAIRSYGDSLSKEVKNAFRGVEGRLKEIPFIVSSQNNYELISDAIQKKNSFELWKKNPTYESMLDESYQIPDFNTLFERQDFDEIVGKGAYPLTPLSALLLLGLSERVAQNERTIFTFLASRDLNSMAVRINAVEDSAYIGTDTIYDYFSPLLEEEKDSDIHNEWIKAQHAITKTEDSIEQNVIKALSVIRIINRRDDVPATEDFIRLALGISKEQTRIAVNALVDKNLIVFKKSDGAYDFQNRIGINVDQEITDCIAKYYSKVDVPGELNKINRTRFILPKKYNQDHFMTRYFEVRVMNFDAFERLPSMAAIETGKESDGFLVLILKTEEGDLTKVEQHIRNLKRQKDKKDSTEEPEKGIVAGIIDSEEECIELVKSLLAIQRLMADESFMKENEVLESELQSLETLSITRLNQWITEQINKLQCVVTYEGYSEIDKKGLNRTISDLCEKIYYETPIINHELINRHNVSAQVSKARNIILDDLLHGRPLEKYETGTSAESTIFRATIKHTLQDENLRRVREEIVSFIHESSKGDKVCFSDLINKLTDAPIGMRRGPIPIYIMEELVKLYDLADMPVVYQDKIERSIDAQLIGNIVSSPDDYALYVEVNTGEKLEYIEGLEALFSEYNNFCREIENRNRLSKITCVIQAWYRSLPQTTTTFRHPDYENQHIEKIVSLRRLLRNSVNPREFLFDQIPRLFGSSDLKYVLNCLKQLKNDLDSHIHAVKKEAEKIVRCELKLASENDFFRSLKEWYVNLPDEAKNSVLSFDSQRLLNVIRDLNITDNEEIIERLSKCTTNFFVEDWTDDTITGFGECVKSLVSELHEKENVAGSAVHRISFETEDGNKEILYDFDSENLSPAGFFFQSALDDLMEEYGETVDNKEKIGLLMSMVKKIMG